MSEGGIIARRAHPLACQCVIDVYADHPGDVYECGDCGRTWVSVNGSGRWRIEFKSERRRRLGLRWWQRTPPVTPPDPDGKGKD